MIWHSAELDDIIRLLKTDKVNGISNGEAESRLSSYGHNTLSYAKERSFLKAFLSEANNFTVIALLLASVIAFIVSLISGDGKWLTLFLTVGIIVLNCAVGAYQKIKSEDTADLLKDISAPAAAVIRDGIKKQIDASLLVPGDIILLSKGDYISADARIISANALVCDEAVLTGSHAPVVKDASALYNDITPVAERDNMVFAGCSVTNGTAVAVVTLTGTDTEIGKTKVLVEQSESKKIPIKDNIYDFGKAFSIATVIVCLVIFVIQMIRNIGNANITSTLIEAITTSLALAVAALPESFPAAATVILTLGVERLITEHAIVTDLSVVEKIGSIAVICSDKTGTLTENRMTVTKVFNGREMIDIESGPSDDINMIIELATVCNNASEIDGDPTGRGIAEACMRLTGMTKQDTENLYPRLSEIPFDSERKLMTTVNMINGKPFAIVKGAPESLLPICLGNCEEALTPVINSMAEDSLRVIAIAAKPLSEIPSNPNPDEIETGLNFLGLIGLEDSPRSDAVRSVLECKKAGIRTVMLTGDHPATAKAFAKRLGILTGDELMLTGTELALMSDSELFENIERYSVFARITGSDRARIIDAWQKKGVSVAVTGDSVEDVEALMTANVGFSMGKKGTDVAKGVSDIILEDDNFQSIVNSVKEGRGIYANMRKVLNFLVCCNIGELLLMLFGTAVFGTFPVNSVGLLWINLITDILPVIAIGMEPPEKSVMSDRSVRQQLFSAGGLINLAVNSVLIGALSIWAFAIGNRTSVTAAATMCFGVTVLSQIFLSLSVRTETSFAVMSLRNNICSCIMAGIGIILTLLVSLTPIRDLFGLTLIPFGKWMLILLFAFIPFIVSEITKAILNR